MNIEGGIHEIGVGVGSIQYPDVVSEPGGDRANWKRPPCAEDNPNRKQKAPREFEVAEVERRESSD
jgi:hypothetical protein